jgi:hypothetical protein
MECNFYYWFISEENIKIDLKETELEGVGWIDLVQNRSQWQVLISTILTFPFP